MYKCTSTFTKLLCTYSMFTYTNQTNMSSTTYATCRMFLHLRQLCTHRTTNRGWRNVATICLSLSAKCVRTFTYAVFDVAAEKVYAGMQNRMYHRAGPHKHCNLFARYCFTRPLHLPSPSPPPPNAGERPRTTRLPDDHLLWDVIRYARTHHIYLRSPWAGRTAARCPVSSKDCCKMHVRLSVTARAARS